MGETIYINGVSLPFGLKNTFVEFQKLWIECWWALVSPSVTLMTSFLKT
jgi:hypothetical protein